MPDFGPIFRQSVSSRAAIDSVGRWPYRVPSRRPVPPACVAMHRASMYCHGGEGRRQNRTGKLSSRHFCQNAPGFALTARCLLGAVESRPGAFRRPSARLAASGGQRRVVGSVPTAMWWRLCSLPDMPGRITSIVRLAVPTHPPTGTMKIATWNVNSVRARLERLLALLQKAQPDRPVLVGGY